MMTAIQHCPLLFVYGTLMQGMGNPFSDELTRQADFQGRGSAHGRLYDYRREYPCAVLGIDRQERIQGEIYRLHPGVSLFQRLDYYEDCYPDDVGRSLFVRCVVPVRVASGGMLDAWMYFWNRPSDGLDWISGGDYRLVSR